MSKNCTGCPKNTSGSDNFGFNCPARMADGRHFTDYRPRCTQDYIDKVGNKLMSSYEQRMYFTQNAENIMKENAVQAYMMNRCGPCVEPYDIATMLPEFEKQICNARTCSFAANDVYGLGLGRSYYDDNQEMIFKKKFLEEKTKEQQFFKQNGNCCGAVDAAYYPITGVVSKGDYGRASVPSGGDVGNVFSRV